MGKRAERRKWYKMNIALLLPTGKKLLAEVCSMFTMSFSLYALLRILPAFVLALAFAAAAMCFFRHCLL